jgi:hypothetical protein
MKVEKIKLNTSDSLMSIDSPFKSYYKLKSNIVAPLKKGKKSNLCPLCKKGHVTFSEKNRVLKIMCDTRQCKNNIEFPIDTYYSYDTLYESNHQHYMNSVNEIVQKKYDILFKYTSDHDISELRTSYLKNKQNYDDMNQHYYVNDKLRTEKLNELYQHRDELMKKMNADEMNDVLNEIHVNEYKQIGNKFEFYTPFSELFNVN